MTKASFQQDSRIVRRFRVFSRAVGVLMCVIGLVMLVDWWWLPQTSTAIPSKLSMTINAAIGVALSGGALLLGRASVSWRFRLGLLLSLVVLGIGAAPLIEHFFALNLGVVHWLERAVTWPVCASPRRMPGSAAAAFALLGGLGLLTSLRRWLWLREAIALVLLATAMTGLASFGFTHSELANPLFSGMPLMTALLLLVATLGWLSATPTIGLTRITTADTLGGAFARRVLLPALLLPVVFTYAFQRFQSWLGWSEVLTFALMAVFSGGAVAWLVWWVALLLDKLERQRLEAARLRTDADSDALTGLANRRAFDEGLDNLLQGHREHDTVFSLLMLDLDKFKNYNDDFGHVAGDEVLRITGGLLRDEVRPSDLAARYGGEEFALLLPVTDTARAAEVAQRVLDSFRAHAWPRRAVSISIGVAQAVPGDDAAALVRRADAALYEAKNTGRNRAVVAAPTTSPAGPALAS